MLRLALVSLGPGARAAALHVRDTRAAAYRLERTASADYAFARPCAACTSSQMRVGVSGSSRGCTPSVPSALAMALAMTPPAAMMPPSPAPLAPSGLIGEG